MEILKGNYISFVIGPIKNIITNTTITNLSTAASIRYIVKREATDIDSLAVVTKYIGSGLTINAPSTGYITVILNAADTELLEIKEYYHALQIEYSATNVQEISLMEEGKKIKTFSLIQDVARVP
jgi:hypothetical protein